MMLRQFFALPLLLLIGMLCWNPQLSSHDTFYPHHREDFESLTRRRELQGTVLLSTAVFLSVLGAVVYIAFRKSREAEDADSRTAKAVQERLAAAANRAARAAEDVLTNTEGDVVKATETALTAYAETTGVTWQPRSYGQRHAEAGTHHLRCKIGSDVVTLSISAEVIHFKAEHSFSKSAFGSQGTPESASVVLRIARAEKAEDVSGG